MTEQQTPIASVVMELAASRGIEDAERLMRRVHSAGYTDATAADVIEGGRGGFGCVLDEVLGLSEEERRRIVKALAAGWRL
jgi:hypothetical protein